KGTIAGTVTFAKLFAAPPSPAAQHAAPAGFPRAARPLAAKTRGARAVLPALVRPFGRGGGPAFTPNELLVRVRPSAVGRPPAATTAGNDPFSPIQAWHYGMIDAPRAWDLTKGSASDTVAVVDDGIRFDHPDIAANLTSDGYDFVSVGSPYPVCAGGTADNTGDGDGYDPDPTDPVSYDYDFTNGCITGPRALGNHGLHVAGTIGAVGNNGEGGTGVNWTVRIRPVRVLDVIGSGAYYDVAQGILYRAVLPGAGGTCTG